jgi:hypothetical protein
MRSVALFVLIFFATVCSAQIHVGPGETYPDLGSASHARAIKAGDTVYLHAGTYKNAIYWIDSLIGKPDAWITIEPYHNDSVCIIDQYQFSVAQYVHLRGLNFYGDDPDSATRASIYHQLFFNYGGECFTANHDIAIEDCRFTNLNNTGKQSTGACIKFTGTENFIVQNCFFKDGTNMTDGISLNADRNGVVRGCRFENMPIDGSHCKGGTKNITYEKNTFINCEGDGLDIGGDTGPQFFCPLNATWEADSIKVYSNIFINCHTGIQLSSCHNSYIVNNTCFKNTTFAFRSLNASSNHIYLANNHIVNNIFTTYAAYPLYMNASDGGDYTTEFFENNLFHDYKNADPASINWSEMPGVNVSYSFIGDPMFTDTAARDFSLRYGSPAISRGADVSEPATDYNGKPYIEARSIGAVESQEFGAAVVSDQHADETVILTYQTGRLITITGLRGQIEVNVIDILGRTLLTSNGPTLNLSPLPSSGYLLEINANGRRIFKWVQKSD